MRVLLDTHALLWWIAGDTRLSRRAMATIADETNEIFVSAASAWEIGTKHRLGKLPVAGPLAVDFGREMKGQDFRELPISWDHAQMAGLLTGSHRDPFDRMLIAQSTLERMALISNEERFDAYGVTRIW